MTIYSFIIKQVIFTTDLDIFQFYQQPIMTCQHRNMFSCLPLDIATVLYDIRGIPKITTLVFWVAGPLFIDYVIFNHASALIKWTYHNPTSH